MNPSLLNNIRRILETTTIRTQLNDYFETHQIPMDSLLYPPMLQDIAEIIPELAGRVEVVPHIDELDPTNGFVKIGWNLFVMGTNRKFLGHTTHKSLNDLQQPNDSKEARENSLRHTTPQEIIQFIIDTINKYESDISLAPPQYPTMRFSAGVNPVSYQDQKLSVNHI